MGNPVSVTVEGRVLYYDIGHNCMFTLNEGKTEEYHEVEGFDRDAYLLLVSNLEGKMQLVASSSDRKILLRGALATIEKDGHWGADVYIRDSRTGVIVDYIESKDCPGTNWHIAPPWSVE